MNQKFGLILAGGSGKRFAKEKNKQFFQLNHIPIFIYSVFTFIKSNLFNEIGLVVPKDS